jgi:hypothetical protein
MVNGETKGFTSQQRNTLPTHVLARFRTISFGEMQFDECTRIFRELLKKTPHVGKPEAINNILGGLGSFCEEGGDERQVAGG